MEDHVGPPVYITTQLTAEQRAGYRGDLQSISADLRKLAPSIPDANRVQKILRCLDNALGNIAGVS